MNRKNLTAAVLAGLAGVAGIAGSAQAVNINPDGTGQVLLYPYYTINAGNVTLLSVVNTSDDAKAVKVRFMESENSQEVLDFNLYMSAYDVWTAAIVPIDEGEMLDDCDPYPDDDEMVYCEGPKLTIADDETTCTVPDLGGNQPFLPFQYQFLNDGDDGTQTQDRMNEGHFEMIEMGTLITGETCTDKDTGEEYNCPSWAGLAATHTLHKDGSWKPLSCDTLVEAWINHDLDVNDGDWIQDPTDGVEAPSGGLFGGAAIVNPMRGAMHSYDATALNGWSETGFSNEGFGDSIHHRPGTTLPNLDSGDINYGYAFSEDGDTLMSGYVDRSVDAVSYVLMHDTLMNEYTTEKGVAGETEWVVTFPTKRFYVWDVANVLGYLPPFTTEWDYALPTSDYATACETVELRTMWDREERTEPDPTCEDLGNCPGSEDPVVSPPRPGQPPEVDPARIPFELCYETNVIRFGAATEEDDDVTIDILPDATEILGSPKPKYLNFDNARLGFEYGWARVELDDYLEAIPIIEDKEVVGWEYEERSRYSLGQDDPLNGLPFIGFSVTRFSNGFIPVEDGQDVFSSYGGLFKHKSSRKVGSDMPGPTPK